jgi:hypothetical protein
VCTERTSRERGVRRSRVLANRRPFSLRHLPVCPFPVPRLRCLQLLVVIPQRSVQIVHGQPAFEFYRGSGGRQFGGALVARHHNLHLIHHRRAHLTRQSALPDERVQSQLPAVQQVCHVLRRPLRVRRPNSLVRLLRVSHVWNDSHLSLTVPGSARTVLPDPLNAVRRNQHVYTNTATRWHNQEALEAQSDSVLTWAFLLLLLNTRGLCGTCEVPNMASATDRSCCTAPSLSDTPSVRMYVMRPPSLPSTPSYSLSRCGRNPCITSKLIEAV